MTINQPFPLTNKDLLEEEMAEGYKAMLEPIRYDIIKRMVPLRP